MRADNQPPELHWEPDPLVADAARAAARSHIPLTAMPLLDRCFYVAELTAQGVTAKEIADLSGCGERLVKYARAEAATIMALATRKETVQAEKELREERGRIQVLQFELALALSSVERLRGQRDQMVDKLKTDGRIKALPCGHPDIDYNIYTYTDRSGEKPRERTACRQCGRDRLAKYRAEKRRLKMLFKDGVTPRHNTCRKDMERRRA